MIYILIGLIIYSLILTLFVIRVNNKLDEIENKLSKLNDEVIESYQYYKSNIEPETTMLQTPNEQSLPWIQPDDLFNEEESFIGNIPPIPPADLFLNENNDATSYDEWVKQKEDWERQQFKKLNKDYKAY